MGTSEIIKKFIESSSVIDRISREIFERLPLNIRHRLYYGKTFLYWAAFLKESEYWDKERLEAFQFEQLKRLLRHAAQKVPYYREVFADYGFDPEKMQDRDDLKVLPYLTKETVRDRMDDFIADGVSTDGLLKTTTSGSTGIPLTIYTDREAREIFGAYLWNLLGRVGFDPKKKVVVFQWKEITNGRQRDADFLRYGNKLVLSAKNVHLGGVEWMQKYYEMIAGFGPEFISGYATILFAVALFMRERGK